MTLSPQVRVFALLGALAAAGLLLYMFVLGSAQGESAEPAAPAVVMRPATPRSTPTSSPKATPPATRAQGTKSGFPPVVDRALRRHGVAVVAVYLPGAAVDAVVRAEARTGARRARVGFVAVSAVDERIMGALVAKAGVLPAPAVLVVKRPGVVTATFGVTDSGTIAQTAILAKR